MNNYDWFTGGALSAEQVLALGREGVLRGISDIGIDETQNAGSLADEILAEAAKRA